MSELLSQPLNHQAVRFGLVWYGTQLFVWSYFILKVHLLTLYKLSVNIQSHVNSVSLNIQQKCLLTVNMFCCNMLLTFNYLYIESTSIVDYQQIISRRLSQSICRHVLGLQIKCKVCDNSKKSVI